MIRLRLISIITVSRLVSYHRHVLATDHALDRQLSHYSAANGVKFTVDHALFLAVVCALCVIAYGG